METEPDTGSRPGTGAASDLDRASRVRRSLAAVDASRESEIPVPDDAGEYSAALAAVLARFADGWGRWISCDAGWYPILARLDGELARVEPGYVLHQVKEKFGVLRYYWDFAELPMPCCDRWQADHPAPERYVPLPNDPDDLAELQAAWDRWRRARSEHEAGSEHQAALAVSAPERARRAEVRPRMAALVDAAEAASARTCERCGNAGQLWERHGWVKTVCDACASALGYTTQVPVAGGGHADGVADSGADAR